MKNRNDRLKRRKLIFKHFLLLLLTLFLIVVRRLLCSQEVGMEQCNISTAISACIHYNMQNSREFTIVLFENLWAIINIWKCSCTFNFGVLLALAGFTRVHILIVIACCSYFFSVVAGCRCNEGLFCVEKLSMLSGAVWLVPWLRLTLSYGFLNNLSWKSFVWIFAKIFQVFDHLDVCSFKFRFLLVSKMRCPHNDSQTAHPNPF